MLNTKIRNFRFKFLHRRMSTNSFLSIYPFGEGLIVFFISIHLIPASHVLDSSECLGFKGQKDDILVSHCLLLTRYYIAVNFRTSLHLSENMHNS